jgi:hypothetical protein
VDKCFFDFLPEEQPGFSNFQIHFSLKKDKKEVLSLGVF